MGARQSAATRRGSVISSPSFSLGGGGRLRQASRIEGEKEHSQQGEEKKEEDGEDAGDGEEEEPEEEEVVDPRVLDAVSAPLGPEENRWPACALLAEPER